MIESFLKKGWYSLIIGLIIMLIQLYLFEEPILILMITMFLFFGIGIVWIISFSILIDYGVEDGIEKTLKNNPFKGTHVYHNENFRIPFCRLILNTDNRKMQFIRINSLKSNDKNIVKVIDFKSLIEVKVVKNSQLVSTTSSNRNLAGAAVGGLLFGGAGAVVGGLGRSAEEIESLVIELVIDNIDIPVLKLEFINSPGLAIKADAEEFKEISEIVNEWYRRLNVIVHQNNN